MKPNTRINLTILLLISISATAQNWQPINKNEKFNYYRFEFSDEVINKVIWVDSISLDNNNDTIFHLNRIVGLCDNKEDVWCINQAHFLKKEMLKTNEGAYFFYNPGSFVLYPHKPLGETWLFDTLNNFTAEVTVSATEVIFGTTDSVKTIEISDGSYYKLSKSFGLLEYYKDGTMPYELTGINGRNLGTYVPEVSGVYDYQVGDVFQWYTITHTHIPNYDPWGFPCLTKRTILTKEVYGDSVVYQTEEIGVCWKIASIGAPYDSSFFFYYDTISFSNADDGVISAMPYQAVYTDEIGNDDDLNYVCFARIMEDNQGHLVKTFGDADGQYPIDYYYNYYQNDTLLEPYIEGWRKVTETLGLEYSWFILEVGGDRELLGYVRNGDTTGLIYPDDIFWVGNNEKSIKEFNWQIAPNPACGYTDIIIERDFNKDLYIRLCNANGELIHTDRIKANNNTLRLYLNGLNKGIYLLSLEGEGIKEIKKLIVK